jgi:hypothetical protein
VTKTPFLGDKNIVVSMQKHRIYQVKTPYLQGKNTVYLM